MDDLTVYVVTDGGDQVGAYLDRGDAQAHRDELAACFDATKAQSQVFRLFDSDDLFRVHEMKVLGSYTPGAADEVELPPVLAVTGARPDAPTTRRTGLSPLPALNRSRFDEKTRAHFADLKVADQGRDAT